MGSLTGNLFYAVRTLVKNRIFALAIILALALGIGANTAIFSVVYAALLRPLPFEDPDRLVLVFQRNEEWGVFSESASAPNFVDWREQNQVFEGMVSSDLVSLTLTSQSKPERLTGAQVSRGFFDLLGVQARLGRTFRDDESGPAGGGVAVLSPGFWRRRFGGDPGILGQSMGMELSASYELRANPASSFTVIGVLQDDIELPDGSRPDIWLPQTFNPMAIHRDATFLLVLGRLKPGVTVAGAQAGMTAVAQRLEKAHPDFNRGWGTRVVG
ncbi:MAG: ABC transporter permease, partial [Planctomycetota bacterium]